MSSRHIFLLAALSVFLFSCSETPRPNPASLPIGDYLEVEWKNLGPDPGEGGFGLTVMDCAGEIFADAFYTCDNGTRFSYNSRILTAGERAGLEQRLNMAAFQFSGTEKDFGHRDGSTWLNRITVRNQSLDRKTVNIWRLGKCPDRYFELYAYIQTIFNHLVPASG